ncbi:MAG: hypothetical protein U0640_10440 [Phycisphaerales bacterium]
MPRNAETTRHNPITTLMQPRLSKSAAGTATMLLACCMLTACSSPPARAPIDVLTDRKQSTSERTAAIQSVEKEAAANSALAETLSQALQEILWSPAQPRTLRRDALTKLAKDEKSLATLKTEGPSLLVREPDPVIVADLCELAASKGWREWTPSLIRVFSRTGGQMDADTPGLSEQDKQLITSRDWKYATSAEKAIATLEQGIDINAVLWKYIVDQPEKLQDSTVVRRDAYTVLSQRDASGDIRRRLISESTPASQDGKLIVEALKAGQTDLRVLPNQGEELRWLLELAERKSEATKAYWNEAAQAVKSVPTGTTVQLRHLEALRWANANHSEWLAMDRNALLQLLDTSLANRNRISRSWGSRSKPYNENAASNTAQSESTRYTALDWADFIVVLSLNDVVNNPANASRLIQQATLDNSDRTSEYGGLILSINAAPQTPILYPPRAKDKRGDLEFHAPDDMIRDQTRALAHYHFHATAEKNQEAAGPSVEDLQYATSWARGCVVFTSASKGRLNVDYYQPSSNNNAAGIVLDLGTITSTGFEQAH